ncbi:MAG: hypothetical protein A3G34_03105 [Candidatus Lindowbacteria bacterium RIFCSPLOWO2_12_FULL_62_27]|nr:MAG: hypothetical protein A3G34_03105 [Candidatus Lindowbacteria bacterium RIFCSPLOWO2_12_FULL_62_27]OGH62233.1 MAG: hypothetical protein A3I06_05415 [Candidatus Lindowbacteria bacterium RIFCSPLOWO2_02_FULL_62_12]
MEAQFLKIRGRERIYPVARIHSDTQEVVVETEIGELPFPIASVEFVSLEDLRPRVPQSFEDRPTSEVDLHGLTVEEGLSVLDRAVENAVAAGSSHLLVIHGKGSGTLRLAVWDYLRKDPRIGRFALDHTSLDPTGATRVDLL